MRRRKFNTLALAAAAPSLPAAAAAATGSRAEGEDGDCVSHVAWSRHTSLYEVNVRQFSAAGTLAEVQAQLPRLQAMGVGALWFMPLQPIGVLNRKGTLGSYYSIRDYTAVNPEFGTLADFKRLVARAHALGMKVLLDWVANHTAWDHPWVRQHPAWYQRDAQGRIHAFVYPAAPGSAPEVWADVVGLDYHQPGLWPAMTDAMAFWLREADIDGFRCDVAGLVPIPFWTQARAALSRIKPMFMLAEADLPALHRRAFDATYDWDLCTTLQRVAQGRDKPTALHAWWQREQAKYPPDAYRMAFTTNHDINSWAGSDRELYGQAFEAMAVLAATLPGLPLVYGGQEAGLDRRLAFFERDPIAWKGLRLQGLYTRLLQLKRTHAALANGAAGGALQWQPAAHPQVLAYTRQRDGEVLRVTANLGPDPAEQGGRALAPWGWRIETA
ncbi:MAG: DUF3459 domain-containing protein [Burkholderiales bacterium]|nr:DUF3459 domain-containing protein [Burkholderiales bacterium]